MTTELRVRSGPSVPPLLPPRRCLAARPSMKRFGTSRTPTRPPTRPAQPRSAAPCPVPRGGQCGLRAHAAPCPAATTVSRHPVPRTPLRLLSPKRRSERAPASKRSFSCQTSATPSSHGGHGRSENEPLAGLPYTARHVRDGAHRRAAPTCPGFAPTARSARARRSPHRALRRRGPAALRPAARRGDPAPVPIRPPLTHGVGQGDAARPLLSQGLPHAARRSPPGHGRGHSPGSGGAAPARRQRRAAGRGRAEGGGPGRGTGGVVSPVPVAGVRSGSGSRSGGLGPGQGLGICSRRRRCEMGL